MKALLIVAFVALVVAHPVTMLAVVATVTALSLGAVVARAVIQPAPAYLRGAQ